MLKATRGSLTLFIGVSAGLLIALLSSLFVSLASSTPQNPLTPVEILPEIRALLPAPYASLVPEPAVSAKVRSGATYQFVLKDEGCVLTDAAAPNAVIGTVAAKWCRIPGGSIEGRFVHLLSGTRGDCRVSAASCEQPPISTWSVFDLRSHVLRPVPVPVRGGEWEAVDTVRSMGLFRGAVRSTLHADQQEDFWALTDVTGAAFWTGRIHDIDADAQAIAGERMLSRPDNGLLLSYLIVNQAGDEELRLATFAGKAWRLITIPPTIAGKTWRLESWALEKGKWTATVAWLDEQNEKQMEKVVTQ